MERLLLSFSKRDYATFQAITIKRLPRTFRKERFSELAEALHSLGKLGERHCERAGARAGGGYIGSFALHFEAGAVGLQLTVVGEKISSFSFSGPELSRALLLERQGLLIDRVAIADFKGRASQVFDSNQTIVVTTRVAGATRDKRGAVDIRVEVRVFRGRAAVSVNRHFAARKGRVRDGPLRLRGVLRLQQPGRYRLALTAFDQLKSRSAQGSVVLRVRGAPTTRPRRVSPEVSSKTKKPHPLEKTPLEKTPLEKTPLEKTLKKPTQPLEKKKPPPKAKGPTNRRASRSGATGT